MHLAYFDETGTDQYSTVVMFGALIVRTGKFGRLSTMHETAIQQILPYDKVDDFKEFHARDLYRGEGIFEGVDEPKRFTAIRVLLSAIAMEELPFVYAALDRKKIASSPFGMMRPLHAAFHMCLLGVEDWATSSHESPQITMHEGSKLIDWNDTFLCILDDCDDKTLKADFKKTYRSLRIRHPFAPPFGTRLWHAHDDMFFADSADCLGVQMVDLCDYFVRLHLEGINEPEGFYHMISKQVICAKPQPEWSQYGHLFRTHERGVPTAT